MNPCYVFFLWPLIPLERFSLRIFGRSLPLGHTHTAYFFLVKWKICWFSVRLLLLTVSSCPSDNHSSHFLSCCYRMSQGHTVRSNFHSRVNDSNTKLTQMLYFPNSVYWLQQFFSIFACLFPRIVL